MTDHSEPAAIDLPASLAAAWGLREQPRKGPKRGLSLDRIVETAVAVAETDGLAAVSMGRVAAELGASTMSLYRYVGAKDELLALMVDAAGGPPPTAGERDEGWRTGLTRWTWAYRRMLVRHPWIVRVPISGPPITPNSVAWMENGLRTMRDTTLAEHEKLSVILLFSGFVRTEVTLMADLAQVYAAAAAQGRGVLDSYGRRLAELTDRQRFPALHQVLDSGVFDTDDTDGADDEFVFGLERLLDGVAALVTARAE